MVSVIIPTFNRSKILAKTLDIFKTQSMNHNSYEIIVVDDGSTEDISAVVSASELRCNHQIIRLPQRSFNTGKPKNEGAKKAKGDVLVFADCDIMFFQNTLYSHYEVARQGSVSLGHNYTPDNIRLQHPLDTLNMDFSQYTKDYRSIFGLPEDEHKEAFPFRFCNTGNASMLKRMFNDVGGFDENFTKWGYEDNELGYRLWKKGAKFVFNKDAAAIHHPHFRHLFVQDRFSEMGRYFLKKHPVYEVEILTTPFWNLHQEFMKIGSDIAKHLEKSPLESCEPLDFKPNIILGSGELPAQKSDVYISMAGQRKTDLRLMGMRLPYDDGAAESLIISAYWRFLPLRVLSEVLTEAFRVSKRVLVQTLTTADTHSTWSGHIDDLLLLGSDAFEFMPLVEREDMYEVIPSLLSRKYYSCSDLESAEADF